MNFEGRKYVLIAAVLAIALIFVLRLFWIQVVDDQWKASAASMAERKITDYPARGFIYDRKGRLLVANTPVYDLMVVPREVKDFDTAAFAALISVPVEELKLRMTAARRALNKTRGKTRLVDFDQVALDKASDHDPEMSVLRRVHRDEIAAIFRDAISAIPAEERTLLRLHYVQGSTLAELAAIRRVSKSALQRQMDGIREALFERIATLVRQRIRLNASQQGSMLRIFQSDLREALGQMLREG